MSTFNLLIEKITCFKNNIFLRNYKHDGVDGIHKVFFEILHNNDGSKYSSKFHYLDDTLNNFYFYNNPDKKNEFLNLFYKIQKVYCVLNRFCYLYKYKKSKLVVDTDLELNTIKLGEPNILCIYHVNSRYLFKVQDLLKLIYIFLTNSYMFFSEPISIKNPYNNIPFGKSVLYYINYVLSNNIYINFIKYKYLDIFFKFKECNFNMTMFVNNYEYILRNYSIKNFINNSTKETLKDEILQIIDDFNKNFKSNSNKIDISDEFPDTILLRVFQPYLHLKLVSKFSLVNKIKTDAKRILHKKLEEFQKFNPSFGRKILKFKNILNNDSFKIKRVKMCEEFNVIHKKFDVYNNENFMSNHLCYKYDQYNDNYYDYNDNNNNNNNNSNNNDNNSDDEIPELIPIPDYSNVNISENLFNFSTITRIYVMPEINNNNYEQEYEPEDEHEDEDNEYEDDNDHDNNVDDQVTIEEFNDNESLS